MERLFVVQFGIQEKSESLLITIITPNYHRYEIKNIIKLHTSKLLIIIIIPINT